MGRGPMGRGAAEKANDFKGAMKRLFSELNTFRILIFLALILAIAGSVLSILAPDRLKDLTNEIQEGITVNKDNMKIVMANLVKLKTGNISDYEIDGVTISVQDQMELAQVVSTMNKDSDVQTIYSKIE